MEDKEVKPTCCDIIENPFDKNRFGTVCCFCCCCINITELNKKYECDTCHYCSKYNCNWTDEYIEKSSVLSTICTPFYACGCICDFCCGMYHDDGDEVYSTRTGKRIM